MKKFISGFLKVCAGILGATAALVMIQVAGGGRSYDPMAGLGLVVVCGATAAFLWVVSRRWLET